MGRLAVRPERKKWHDGQRKRKRWKVPGEPAIFPKEPYMDDFIAPNTSVQPRHRSKTIHTSVLKKCVYIYMIVYIYIYMYAMRSLFAC